MKFIKPFVGVKAGDVYPSEFAVGAECPPELIAAATETGAIAAAKVPAPSAKKKA